MLASHDDYPARLDKVDDVLTSVAGLRSSAPVATQRARHRQLGVAEDRYDRKLTWVDRDGASQTAYLGSGPGFGRVNLRLPKSDEVHSAKGLAVHDVEADPGTWIEREYVKLDEAGIESVKVESVQGMFTLERQEDGWQLAEHPDAQLDKTKTEAIVSAVATIRADKPVGREVQSEFKLGDNARVTVLAKIDDAVETVEIVVGGEKDGKYDLKSDQREHVVLVSKWSLDKLINLDLDKLTAADDPDGSDEPTPPWSAATVRNQPVPRPFQLRSSLTMSSGAARDRIQRARSRQRFRRNGANNSSSACTRWKVSTARPGADGGSEDIHCPVPGGPTYSGWQEKEIREATISILDAPVDSGSSAAYRIRDDFRTPVRGSTSNSENVGL